MKNYIISSILLFCCIFTLPAQTEYKIIRDLSYLPDTESDNYRQERCKLDLYYPVQQAPYATLIWFHGGGLEAGNKYIPQELASKGFAVVTPNYRLSPKAQNPAYIQDAAAAVAWVMRHIGLYGGDPTRIFVSGHSAGGYLSLILATDKSYMAAYHADADSIAAYLPVSGQTVTHFTIRKERGLPHGIPVIDEFAPCNKARKDTAPIILLTGDRNLEMADRYEENALFASVMKNIGNPNVMLYELQGFDHNTVVGPACCFICDYVRNFKK